jgi:hypothetical protein
MYVVSYTDDTNGFKYVKILDYPDGMQWRELQQKFDPKYFYSNLKFYLLGCEILLEK